MSLRIADIGVPIPPRVGRFLDGPEVEALDGARAWGIEGIDHEAKLKLRWASGRLHDIFDIAVEGSFDPDTRTKYLPIASLGAGSHMFCVDVKDPALAVYFFDGEAGFKKWADDFESFTKQLLKRGEEAPTERLEKACEAATAAKEAKNYSLMIETLMPIVARFPRSLTYGDDGSSELGTAYNLLGVAHENLGNIDKARDCYTAGLALSDESAGLNLCDLLLEKDMDYEQLVQQGEKQRESIWRGTNSHYAWFHIRNYLGQGYLLTNRPRDALRAYHQISTLAIEGPERIREACDDLRALRDKHAARVDTDLIDNILSWLDVPPPALPAGKLEQLRAWWPTIPAPAKDAIRGAIQLTEDRDPTDAELTRIAWITDLEIEDAELADLTWVTPLERLDDLDIEDNDIADITPLASLRFLTRLDISNNKITSLKPLAKLTRLDWLVADENPLASLEGLENLHDLDDLHCTEAGLTSLEPLRGLRGLQEITIYENRIDDISPLADCPRLKEISSFTNPLKRGFAALGKLQWLESIDAGDESDAADLKALRAANPLVKIDHWYPDDDNDNIPDPDETPDEALVDWWAALPKEWRKALDGELPYGSRGKPNPPADALTELIHEDHITIEKQPLPDLEPLRKFERLDFLCLEQCGVTNLAPISRLPRLRDLILRDNKIDLVSLSPGESVEELFVERCQLTSLIGIERCRRLREIHAEDNDIDDLRPVAELVELRELDFEGNRVSDLTPLANLVNLRELKLGMTRITDLAPLANLRALRELEVWGTPKLSNTLVLADLPELTKVISHGSIPKSDVAELRRRRPDLEID